MIKILLACLLTIWMPYSAMAWRTDGWPAKYATEWPIKELRNPKAKAFPYLVKSVPEKVIFVKNRRIGFIVPEHIDEPQYYRGYHDNMIVDALGEALVPFRKTFKVDRGKSVILHGPKRLHPSCSINGVTIDMNEMGVPYAIVFFDMTSSDRWGTETIHHKVSLITELDGKLIEPDCSLDPWKREYAKTHWDSAFNTVEVGSETMEIAGKKITIEKSYMNPGRVFGLTTSKKGVDFIRRWIKEKYPDTVLGF